jgi:hypothetical protein
MKSVAQVVEIPELQPWFLVHWPSTTHPDGLMEFETGLTGEVSECEAEEAICTAGPRTSAGRSTLDVHEGRLCRPPVGQPR